MNKKTFETTTYGIATYIQLDSFVVNLAEFAPYIYQWYPKSFILIGLFIRNHPFRGTPIFGNTHVNGFQNSKSSEIPVANRQLPMSQSQHPGGLKSFRQLGKLLAETATYVSIRWAPIPDINGVMTTFITYSYPFIGPFK